MKELKLSSKYDNFIGTLYNGEKLYSASVNLHSSDLAYLKELHEEYYHKMDSFERLGSIEGSTCIVNILGWIDSIDPEPVESDSQISEFPDCKYRFGFKIIYAKEPSKYNLRGLQMGYLDLLAIQKENKE